MEAVETAEQTLTLVFPKNKQEVEAIIFGNDYIGGV